MICKRSKKSCYSYNFRWTIKNADGTKESFRIVKSARAKNRKDAQEAEEEHRRALRLGLIHPLDPWPTPPPSTSTPVMREFAMRFLRHAQVDTKKGTRRFYGGCTKRLLAFTQIADARLDAITSELVGQYADYRMEVAENEIATINGDLRTLRRIFNLAEEWKQIPHAPVIHEMPGAHGRDYSLPWAQEAKYLAAASPNLRDAAIILLDTGVRPQSELFPLA
jgi:hypothetical protein